MPEILTPDIIDILVLMSDEMPQSKEWQEIFKVLSDDNYRKIVDRKIEMQREKSKQNESFKTEEQKQEEARIRAESNKNLDPNQFIGNMGQPETIEEYKNRYGAYPLGYDENGKKMKE